MGKTFKIVKDLKTDDGRTIKVIGKYDLQSIIQAGYAPDDVMSYMIDRLERKCKEAGVKDTG